MLSANHGYTTPCATTYAAMGEMSNNREAHHYGQRIIFTGPDGIGDYRQRLCDFPRYIGEGGGSSESTGDLGYLWRAAPHTPPHRSRDSYVGGVGWGWYYNQRLNQEALLSNMQIKKTDIRAAVEDTVAQRFQPPPRKKTASDSPLQAHKKFSSENGR
ncbi:uncharacterized protein C4orf45 homolog [Boleophthalmus pectinirostris]|uniref:uncharacterized protein C4orf45 homolog n=1 Tax=Boleophthalmus pectinirostris TaxID=150288 RepID=UPI00242AF250|nr:uncharacterized protein C4orf45 homolog [Boleophthalmus pectinirostris]